ncbi:MAG TPA: hypothetical protein VKA26_02875 [Ignavibacteriaceae bacterium]|nr:hypothetical protein [Ignavibacteriaceae bacterium]
MYNFCTLFDSNYLSRGLALYDSLKKSCEDFHLYIFAFDAKSENVLNKMQLKNATIIPLKDFEDKDLLEVKPTRTIAEYCWTSTSSTILYVLENFEVESCTYIDADMYFYSSPKPIFDELGNDSILITEHRYTPIYDKSKKSGKYCVQFVTFKNDEKGLTALKWWRERCLEWCYNRLEDGKFGDQMYLNDWTTRFEGVHIMKHLGGGLAAWNVQQYDFYSKNGKLIGREINSGQEFEVIFYHFHYLRFIKNKTVELGRRILTENVKRTFYLPYINHLENERKKISEIDNSFDPHGASNYVLNWKTPLLYIWRKLRSSYNIFNIDEFIGH